MPIYEYYCKNCAHTFDYLVFGSKNAVECPKCRSNNVNKLISACGFFSKGGDGETMGTSSSSSCSGCSATSCSTCGH